MSCSIIDAFREYCSLESDNLPESRVEARRMLLGLLEQAYEEGRLSGSDEESRDQEALSFTSTRYESDYVS